MEFRVAKSVSMKKIKGGMTTPDIKGSDENIITRLAKEQIDELKQMIQLQTCVCKGTLCMLKEAAESNGEGNLVMVWE